MLTSGRTVGAVKRMGLRYASGKEVIFGSEVRVRARQAVVT
jgi:hypothetical protein